jgi:hypothetical protein
MEAAVPGMTVGGWIFFVCAWGSILSLAVYCFAKLLGVQHRRSVSEATSKEQ